MAEGASLREESYHVHGAALPAAARELHRRGEHEGACSLHAALLAFAVGPREGCPSGTFAGDGGGLAFSGTFEGWFDGVSSFEDGTWDLADDKGFGVVGSGTWSATPSP